MHGRVRPARGWRRHILLLLPAIVAPAALAAQTGAMPLVAHAAPVNTTYYLSGVTQDQADKATFTPSATFGTTAPTDTTPTGIVQQMEWPNDGHDFAESAFDNYWVGSFSGTLSGSITFDWYWSSANPSAIASGAGAYVTIFADPTADTAKGEIAQAHVSLSAGATPTENHTTINLGTATTACPCAVNSTLLIDVSGTDVDTSNVQLTTNYASTAVPSSFTVTTGGTVATPTPSAGPTATPSPSPAGTGTQAFDNYQAPYPYPHEPPPPSVVALLFGEPSIGVDWNTNTTLYQGDLNTWAVSFDYTQKPPVATWNDRSDVATDTSSLDARLISDHIGKDRVFVAQLSGAQSVQAYTDDDGGTTTPPANSADWVAESAGGFPSGVDHESIGAGPYSAYAPVPTGAGVAYPHAVYYCSQAEVDAFCARSDTGGATWGVGATAFSSSACDALHGKPRVGPDGVVYLPDKNCNGNKGVVISKDDGQTWNVVQIPGTSTDANQLDPDVAVGGKSGMGTVYYTYRDGDHHVKVVTSTDDGSTWSAPIDLGAPLGINNAQMTEVVAGDANRAAVTFLGTTASGDDSPESFPGVWYLYVSFTYDGGKTWQTVNATPNDPVQRGGICDQGTGCSSNVDGSTQRNMLDFNDETIDVNGRVEVAYTDGCTGDCVTNPNAAVCPTGSQDCMGRNSSVFTMSDQVCGLGLFARYDPGFDNDTACAAPVGTPEVPSVAGLAVGGGMVIAIVAVATRRRRRPFGEVV